MAGYGSIPTDPDTPAASSEKGSGCSRNACLALAALLGGLGLLWTGMAPTPPVSLLQDPPAEHWPGTLLKIDQAYNEEFPNMMFTTTDGAIKNGFVKSDEPCDPMLGQSWLRGGERSAKYSAAVYFTPESEGSPGVLSAIEADFYGHVEESLIGLFFGEEKTSKDGTFRSISVALRNGEEEDLCAPVAPGNDPYVMISPGMANMPVPLREDDPELLSEWQRGSCIPSMGYHWSRFLSPVTEMPYKTSEMVPIVPMYSSTDGTINGIFFWATSKQQQTWPAHCDGKLPGDPCLSGELNMWDASPGLTEANRPRFFMCSNFCGKDCEFTGTEAGMSTTMHFFFKDTFAGPDAETCGGFNGQRPYCPNGDYPKMLDD